MRSVVRAELNHLDRPTLAVWQLRFIEPLEEVGHLLSARFVPNVVNFWTHGWWVTHHVIFEINRQVDESAHGWPPLLAHKQFVAIMSDFTRTSR